MALDPLASTEDLQDRLKLTLDEAELPRAAALLRDASAKVRNYTGRRISEVTETVRFRVRRGQLRLPNRPVTEVDTVTDVEGTVMPVEWDGLDVLRFNAAAFDGFERDLVAVPTVVDVTYTHGYAEIPDDIIGVVCQIAGRAFGTPTETAGNTAEGIDNYNYSTGGAAAAGGFGLLSDERAVLDSYRTPGASGRFG